MDNTKTNIGIKEIKNIKMTEAEKQHLLENILTTPIQISKPIKSPYLFGFRIQRKYLAYSFSVLFLVIIISGGALVNYSQNKKNGERSNLAMLPEGIEKQLSENLNIENSEIARVDNKKIDSTGEKISTQDNNLLNIPTSLEKNTSQTMGISSTSMIASKDLSSKEYINIASSAFSEWFEHSLIENGNVLDYQINKITFLASRETTKQPEQHWFNQEDSKDSFIVKIDFSVQTNNEGREYWLAGNGEIGNNGWIWNKSLFVTIDKENNTYLVTRAGTGP